MIQNSYKTKYLRVERIMEIKKQLLLLFVFTFCIFSCQSKMNEDAVIIKELLDINNLSTVKIESIVSWEKERIVTLIISDLDITILPDSIQNLTSLKYVHIVNTNLQEIPTAFCNLPNLKRLRLSGNPLDKLPEEIGNLKSLETFSFYSFHFTQIPDSFLQLPNLSAVGFESRAIKTIPLQLMNKTIQHLFISGTNLETIPVEISQMKELESLTLKGIFNTIPGSISKLQSLKQLVINGKNMKTIPVEIYDIISLEELDLQRNDLEYLPLGISRLKHLRDLKLSHNRLTDLPGDIYTTQQWRKVVNGKEYDIDIRDNRICDVTSEQDVWLEKYVSPQWEKDQYCKD